MSHFHRITQCILHATKMKLTLDKFKSSVTIITKHTVTWIDEEGLKIVEAKSEF